MRGPNGIKVEVVRYFDKLGHDKRCYRVSQHGVFVSEYETPEDLARWSTAELVEDDEAGIPIR
jgi:hypothetical protein